MFKEIKNAGVFLFKTRIPIRITDHNYGDHVANNVFVEFLHEGRVRFLASLGYAEKNLEGVALTLSELHVKYARQAFCFISMAAILEGRLRSRPRVLSRNRLRIGRKRTCRGLHRGVVASRLLPIQD